MDVHGGKEDLVSIDACMCLFLIFWLLEVVLFVLIEPT